MIAQADRDRMFGVLQQRYTWENEQRTYTKLRHKGLPRQNKPFPTAADLHFPLIDMQIGDLKPFWMAQAFGGDRLADFVALEQRLMPMAESSADYFDFVLRYQTDLRYKLEQMLDIMLLRGRAVLFCYLDPYRDYRIVIEVVDPIFLIMGQQHDDFDDADEWVWVQHLTIPQYKRNQNYTQTDKVIGEIRGRKDYNFNAVLLDKQLIEGVTLSHNADQTVLWHHYRRAGSGLRVETYCPYAQDVEIRKPFEVPYKFNGEVSNPFTSFTMEIKDPGWYSARGIGELNAAFEAVATKCWNEEMDYLTFAGRPLFTSDDPLDNSVNWKFRPGDYVPKGLQAVQMPAVPGTFSDKINFAQSLAMKRSRTPDFGQFSPEEGKTNEPITASEARIRAGLQSVGADHNGDMFRQVRLLKLFKHLWCLMLHADKCRRDAGNKPTLAYFAAGQLRTLPEQALADQYLVIPAGGSANKQQKLARATARYTLLKGDPGINQDELKKDLLAADDARLVDRLIIPMNQKQADEAYQEDVEIGVMEKGRPVPVLPGQDHATRIMEIAGYLHARDVTGKPVDPAARNVILKHLLQHFAILKQTQPQAARQVQQTVEGLENHASGARDGQAQPQLTNGTATNGVAANPPNGSAAAPTEQGPKSPSESISMKLSDFYPSERAQILAGIGIKAATPEEMFKTEQARATVKASQPNPKPKVEGALT